MVIIKVHEGELPLTDAILDLDLFASVTISLFKMQMANPEKHLTNITTYFIGVLLRAIYTYSFICNTSISV